MDMVGHGSSFDLLKLLGEIGIPLALAVAYWLRVRVLAREHRAPSRRRQLSFGAGLLVIVVASVGLAEISMRQVSGHMVQHLLLMDLAAFLVILGVTRPVVEPLLSVPGLRHARKIVRPVPAMLIFIAIVVVWHLPPLYNLTAESELAHAASRTFFLGAGLVKWMALIGPVSAAAWFVGGFSLLYVATEHLFIAVMGNVFMWAGTPIYSVYAERTAAVGIDPVTDQSIGGGIMAVWGMMLTLALLAWVLLRWSKHETERQDLLDLARDNGVAIPADVVARAVRNGQAGAMRVDILRRRHDPRAAAASSRGSS
ncbi:cytochrome c oxidase assembly protein [Thermoleophilia bacterium SCSIO 60948]|nr:cytochrome c oxidase assembly protein [Thermoleophilia bacterium SCSIO 60948]